MPRGLASPRAFLLVIAGYFALHVGLRLITSSTADLDEAEQLTATQQLAWGYGAQPPLYTWLQLPLVKLFGPTILPLALLKAALLTALYAVTYANARRVLRAHAPAVIATLSLLFIPQISWEAQRDLTHSALVTLFAVLAFHAVLRLAEGQTVSRYLLLGLVAGGGLLAKYSFGIFLAGLLLAVVSLPTLRGVVLDRRIFLSGALCAMLVAPAALWAIQHPELTSGAARKLTLGNTHLSWGESVLKGLGKFLVASVTHVGPLLAICALILRARPASATTRDVETQRLAAVIPRGLVIIAVLLAGGILASGASRFLDRWLMPVCVWLPILLVARFREQFDRARTYQLCIAAAAVALVICVAIPARIRFAETLNWPQSLNVPFEPVADELRQSDSGSTLILAENAWLAGNLRRQFPERRIVCPALPLPGLIRPGEPCLVVTDETRKDSATDHFGRLLEQVLAGGRPSGAVHEVAIPMKFFAERLARFTWATGRTKPDLPAAR